MELSPYVEGLRRELAALTRFAPAEVTQVAERLAEALDSSVRLTLLDVLSAAAAEITTRLDDTVIEVRLNAGEPEFVVAAVPAPPSQPTQQPSAGHPSESAGDEAGTARVTLRMSEALKTRVEARAAADGVSINAWLAHAAIRALETPAGRAGSTGRFGIGQRITGYARS